jgi:periplasmic protein TonB
MPKPLLYQPPPRKHVLLALAGALAIELGSVVIASIKHEPPAIDLSQIPSATVEVTMQAEDQPTPPPEDIPMPPPPPEPQVQEFHEETTPPPRRPQTAAPIKAPQTSLPGTMSITGAKAVAIFAPKPEYPYEARSRHVTGSGVCVLSVDVGSGNVTDASMAQSIGNPILDNATVSAFRRWKFRAGQIAPKVKVPITFTMTGASY